MTTGFAVRAQSSEYRHVRSSAPPEAAHPASSRRCWKSSPLIPGIRTSRTKQPGPAAASAPPRKAATDSYSRVSSPVDRNRLCNASRNDSSSSMMRYDRITCHGDLIHVGRPPERYHTLI